MSTFQKNLAFGQIAETRISQWIIARNNVVLPAYDIEYDSGKGPRIFGGMGSLVIPDLLVFGRNGIQWIEAKHKTVFSWHRKTHRWVTGIDLHHYEQYIRVEEITQIPTYLLFLHIQSNPRPEDVLLGCPARCPVGLFGESLAKLADLENHRHANHGRHGMVYWSCETLKLYATLQQVEESSDGRLVKS